MNMRSPKVVRFREGGRIVDAKGQREKGKTVFNECGVSVWDDDGGKGCQSQCAYCH